ncbi:hypothetical protein GCM10027294_02010 [Marinactinospora endophytica]
MPPFGHLLRFLNIAPWAAAAALGVLAVTGLVILVAEVRRSQNKTERQKYYLTGEIRKGRRYLLFGPRVREPVHIPGTRIPLRDMRPVTADEIIESLTVGKGVTDVVTAGCFVPARELAKLRMRLGQEQERIEREKGGMQGLGDSVSFAGRLAREIDREGEPYRKFAERASGLQKRIDNRVKGMGVHAKRAADAAKEINGYIRSDPRVIELEKSVEGDRKEKALEGYSVAEALANLKKGTPGQEAEDARKWRDWRPKKGRRSGNGR